MLRKQSTNDMIKRFNISMLCRRKLNIYRLLKKKLAESFRSLNKSSLKYINERYIKIKNEITLPIA